MDPHQLVDAQFNRAVEIVQGLPKTGPIQTGYEEKLTMYSLYKQATVGNVTTSRPGIFDMLGRAKWDAWAKHKDLDQYEAKCLYVDALLKALNKHSDKTVAKDLIDELRSYEGASENLVLSYTSTRSRASSSSASTASEDNSPMSSPYRLRDFQQLSARQQFKSAPHGESSDDGEAEDESRNLPTLRDQQRPPSSMSFSSRYKTPRGSLALASPPPPRSSMPPTSRYKTPRGSLALASPPPPRSSMPPMQPLSGFEAPSAFADAHRASTPSTHPSTYPVPSSSRDLGPQTQSTGPPYRNFPITSRHSATTMHPRPPSRAVSVSLEHAMGNMQAHLAALTERIDTLESSLATHPQPQAQSATSSHASSGRGSPTASPFAPQPFEWDVDDMGLWSLALKPLVRNLSFLHRLVLFFLTSAQDRSPLQIVIRRLCLDISFVVVVLGALRHAWIKSGARRREVGAALVLLWGALSGRRIPGGRYLRL